MRNSVTLIISLFLLSGCMHCQVATFYKPLAETGTRLRTDSEMPNYAGITLGDVPFTIAVCGGYLPPPGDTVALCISLELDSTASLRFTEPKVNLGAGASPPKSVPMTTIEYEIYCRVENGERTCTSPEESPVTGPVQKISGKGSVDRYAFDPASEFRGAKDTLHEGAWFGHRLTGKRRYLVRTVPISVQRGAELTAQLPEVVLNGQVLTPPVLKFRAVTEEVCRFVPLN